MRKKRILWLFLLFILTVTTGCNRVVPPQGSLNSNAIKEYNKAIELYNRIAVSFTNLVKLMTSQLENHNDIDEKARDIYFNKKSKVIENIDAMLRYQFKYKQIENVMKSIIPLTNKIEKYLLEADEYTMTKDTDFLKIKQNMETLYEMILIDSIEIVESFDRIYKEHICSAE